MTRARRRRARLGPALLVVCCGTLGVLLAGCGGDDDDASKAPVVEPQPLTDVVDLTGQATVDVAAKDNVFEPENIRVDAGTKVEWTNEGAVAHDVKQSNANQDLGGPFGVNAYDFQPGATYDFTFATPGEYRLFCSLHGSEYEGMIAAVVVE